MEFQAVFPAGMRRTWVQPRARAVLPTLVAVAVAFCRLVRADYREEIGYTRLAAELGSSVPAGSGVSVTQVEVAKSSNYMPDALNPEFAGKTLGNMSGLSTGVSGHATLVGVYYYGSATGMASNITAISVWEAQDWTRTGYLRAGLAREPDVETNRVENHSWIGSDPLATNIIRRLDYAIARDGFTAVVALGNDPLEPIPELLAHSYNAVCVGRSDGQHSSGQTWFDAPGRVKPDIVAPLGVTSEAAPVVAAASALLLEAIDRNSALGDAAHPECIKALLLAGATKDEFPAWSRTPAGPLDATYGAGQLSVYNSYHVLAQGRQNPGTNELVAELGWDFGALSAGGNAVYFFDVPEGSVMSRLSVVLAWNRELADWPGPAFDPVPTLPDFDLSLNVATDFSLGALVDHSTSHMDNVEHVYRRYLPAGRYALTVTSDRTADYALAWFGTTALIPAFVAMDATAGSARLTASVSPQVDYGIQASTDLTDNAGWTWVATNRSASNTLIYVDYDAANHPTRFYRLTPDP